MESQEPRWKIFAEPCGLVDFSRLAREWAARLKKIRQKHGVSASIETLDALRYGKKNQLALDALRYGKINQPSVGWSAW
jgi:hypothetical protein